MPTLYDNFSQVRQYIDQEKPDLSSYVTKSELSGCSYVTSSDLNNYLPLEGGTISGRLVSDYYSIASALGGIDSYSSVLAGADNRNSVTMFATRRLCGDTSYAASFFTNSDGRSKFTHKTKTGEYAIGGADDAFMCFNAYGFKIAYSGTQGVGATTEYEILHEGNIGNLGYVTSSDLPVIDENIIPKENNTYTLGNSTYLYKEAYISNIYTTEYNRIYSSSNYNFYFQINGGNKFYMDTIGFYGNGDGTRNLGGPGNKWAATYTKNLYADNIHNFIWTGTSAEYASLPDYTTYQLYLVKDE